MGYNSRFLLAVIFTVCGCGSVSRCDKEDRTVLFKINLKSLTKFNFTVIRYNVVNFFRRIENRLNVTYRFLRNNGSLDPLCGVANDECNATARCCPNFICAPSVNVSGIFNCVERNESSSEEVGNRIRSLYTDGSGSHEWTNGWAFESRSTLEREEELYKEEKEWKEKNVLDSTEETVWKRLVNEVVKRGKEQFDKLQKMKNLNEVKKILKEKLAKRKLTKHYSSKESGSALKKGGENNKETTESVINVHNDKQSAEESERENNEIKSDENLSGVLKSAADLVKRRKKKNREQLKKKAGGKENDINDISWNEDELQKEIDKLKALKEERNANKMGTESERVRQEEMKDLIKKQVALILDEERKLEGLMKLEELKKLEDNMKRRES